PDVPTNIEAGIPDLEGDTITGIVAPAGTPNEIVARWRNDIVKIVAMPEVNERLQTLGFAPGANTPDGSGQRQRAERAQWGHGGRSGPGGRGRQRMPRSPNSRATPRVMETTAPLAAA